MFLTRQGIFGKLPTPERRLEAEGKANRPVLRIPSGGWKIICAHCRMWNMEHALSWKLRGRDTKIRATISLHLLAYKSCHTECIALTPHFHLLPFQDVFRAFLLLTDYSTDLKAAQPRQTILFFRFPVSTTQILAGYRLSR